MSFVTRCSACDTLFRVVDDQLKISQGWVRCGQCAHVFDARAHTTEQELPPAITAITAADEPDVKTSSPHVSHASSQVNEKSEQTLDPSKQTPWRFRSPHESALDAGPTSTNWSPSEIAEALDSFPAPLPAPLDAPDSINSGNQNQSNSSIQQDPSSAPTVIPVTAEPEAQTLPGFLQDAQRARRWRSPWVRVFLSLCAFLLLLALGVQIALQERNEIAAIYPITRPHLQRLCAHAGCKIEPLRRLESILIEDSSFKAQGSAEQSNSGYILNLSLKNTGSLALAFPHIELSLHNGQDQVILRRVLSPAELQAPTTNLQPSAEFTGSAAIQIQASAIGGQSIQGYRVLAFYP